MQITKELLLAKIAAAEASLQKLQADYNATLGARQAMQLLLQDLAQPEPPSVAHHEQQN